MSNRGGRAAIAQRSDEATLSGSTNARRSAIGCFDSAAKTRRTRAATQWVGEHAPPTRYASPGELDVFWRNTRSFEDGAFIVATNQVLRERVPNLGDSVLFVDLDREMSGRNDLFEDVAHTTETGKRLKGERIAAVIREHRARAAAPPR